MNCSLINSLFWRYRFSKLLNVVLALALLVGFGVSVAAAKGYLSIGVWSRSQDSRIVQSVELSQDVTLVRLGNQGIKEVRKGTTIFGWTVPGTSEVSYIRYSYKAALGIDGRDVTITKVNDSTYRITIPKFVFLGHSDESFETVVDDNGVLSFVTADIDKEKAINEILSDTASEELISANEDILKAQAQTFYTSIVHGVDPDVTLQFTFAG